MTLSPKRALSTALIVAIAAFMQVLDASVIGTALPQMARTFGVGPVGVGLGIIVYVLAASIVIPASAWLADRFEAKRVFIVAVGMFTVASVLCGLSGDINSFVLARLAQGAAGAMMAAIGQMILVRSVDRTGLLHLMNIASIPMLVAPVLGPPLGGIITETIGWPWIFYLNIPFGIVGIAMAARLLAPLPTKRRPFDTTGFMLNAAALSVIVYGLESVTREGDARWTGLAALAVGALLGWAAIRHLRRTAHPLLSLAPLRYPTFRISTATALPLIRLPIGALLFALPILLQVGFGMSALMSGLALLAHAAGDLLMKLVMTRAFRRFGYRTILTYATGLTGLGIGACALLTDRTPFAVILLLLFATGCTRSFVMTGLNTLAYDEVAEQEMPSAATLGQIVMQIAAALSVSLATILFDISAAVRGASGGPVTAADCRLVLLVIAGIGLLAVPALLRLPRHAGERLSGRAFAAASAEE